MSEVQKKRNDLTVKEKVSILELYVKLPKMSERNAAVQLKICSPVCLQFKKSEVLLRG
jgi:hypothetical protein